MSRNKYKNRDTSRDYAETCIVPEEIRRKYKTLGLNKGLKIVLYGEPFTDSRPRIVRGTAVSVNKELMKPIFGQLYSRSELLRNTVILSHYVIVLHAYKSPTQEIYKNIKKNWGKCIQSQFEQEELYDVSINDVDNMLKIHNDILFDELFRVCIDDAWNIVDTDCWKKLSNNPRVELFIYYSDKINAYMEWQIGRSALYYKFLISEKNRLMNKRTYSEHVKHMKKTFDKYSSVCKSKDDKTGLVKRTFSVVKEWSADEIKEMANMQDAKFNKRDAQNKIMLQLIGKKEEYVKIFNTLEISQGDQDVRELEGLFTFY